MDKILILANHSSDANALVEHLRQNNELSIEVLSADEHELTHTDEYLKALNDVQILISLLGPWDVDLNFEALFDAIDQVHPPLKMIIMLSTAGVDKEVDGDLDYPGIDNVKEYLNQQRYAIKLVDESEIPYTILRPVKIVEHQIGKPKIIDEGQPVPNGVVSHETLDQVIVQIVTSGKYLNHSIGLIERKEE